MAATKSKKAQTRKGTRETGNAAQRILNAKGAKKSPAQRQTPARSTKDWKDEEANEGEGRSLRGQNTGRPMSVEDSVVGDNYCIGNYFKPSWVDDEGTRLAVSHYYPTQDACIDYPEDTAELKIKQTVFKKLKVPYVGVLPGQPLQIEEARKQLKAQGAKIKL